MIRPTRSHQHQPRPSWRTRPALRALGLLAGLHPGLTFDLDARPMVAAEAIFDAVQAERRELLDEIEQLRQAAESLRAYLHSAKLETRRGRP